MKVLILGDMEGVAGVCRWEHVLAGKPLYEEGRSLYTGELSAAVRGAKQAGASEITVVDTHGAGGDRSFNSIVREALEPGCRYCTQNRWFDFEHILKQGCDAAFIIGMHAMAGTADGVLAHTASYDTWMGVTTNGTPVGETALMSALCAHYGCPTVLVSGDEATSREATALLGDAVRTAAVKQGINKFAAIHMRPEDSRELIEATAAEALRSQKRAPLYKPPEPTTIELQFTSSEITGYYRHQSGVELAGPCGIKVTRDTWYAAWMMLFS